MDRRRPLFAAALAAALAGLCGCASAPPQPADTAAGATASSALAGQGGPGSSEGAVAHAKEKAAPAPAQPAPSEAAKPPVAPAADLQSVASPVPAATGAPEMEAKAEQTIPEAAAVHAASLEPTVRYLSADDSNSQASPVIARKTIRAGRFVHPETIRTYEFLNYHTFDYPAPDEGELAIYAEMAPSSEQGTYTLQVALRSRDRAREDLLPLALTFLVDTSGSMAGEPLDLARRFVLGVAERLHEGDTVSVVSCARSALVLMEKQPAGPETVAVLRDTVLPSLAANDVTDLEQGIRLAYEVAGRSYSARSSNRVILISDGAANAGELAVSTIARYAEDADRQGIYLAGVGVGQGFNDWLMNRFTDAGRGAYLFLDGPEEVDRALAGSRFVSNLDLLLKDVRLKLVLPPGWEILEFHGEQISAVASEVTPQYLAPGDQMIYHLEIKGPGTPGDVFELEAEYRPLGGRPAKTAMRPTVLDMLRSQRGIVKGNAVVAFAEALKEIALPLEPNAAANGAAVAKARDAVAAAEKRLDDAELREILELIDRYAEIVTRGEQLRSARDKGSRDVAAVLGIPVEAARKSEISGPATASAVAPLERLLRSTRLVPQEGYRFLALSSGPVGNEQPAGSGELSGKTFRNPAPEFMGAAPARKEARDVYDLHQVSLTLEAPSWAKSFSFDFDFFSAEYPEYVNQSFNDTFYAILSALSTNRGRPTNIAFDANGASIEVDNNYFQQPFHPIPNTGTGFDRNGSTGWLRTSWPINGGERFGIVFSVHDEGDAIFDSLVVLDNFQFHEYGAAGTTDPLN